MSNKNRKTGPRVLCYLNTSEVKNGKLRVLYGRENKRNQSNNLTNQVKKTKEKEEKYKNADKIKGVRIIKNNNNTNTQ